MYSTSSLGSFHTLLNDFKLDGRMIRYSQFMPRLYNYCLSIGMEAGKIMPSRAFCSDESQGFPIILISKEFGTFPFNHGMVGGVVATDRHGPHTSHGKDMLIIQASHVGYEPESEEFGTYRRLQTSDCHHSTNCGKIVGVMQWYTEEYQFACDNVFLEPSSFPYQISINNMLLMEGRNEGLFLELDKFIAKDASGKPKIIRSLSTTRTFEASPALIEHIGNKWPREKPESIGKLLTADFFHFKRDICSDTEGQEHLESNLIGPMPWIVTHPTPALAAAQINTQVEFDRTYRTLIHEEGYKNKNLIFISGLNIDISPSKGQVFPLTKFIPWAAFIQTTDGKQVILEQKELYNTLMAQDIDNPNKIDLEAEISVMETTEEVSVSFD